MSSAHFVCRNRQALTAVNSPTHTHESGAWDVTDRDVRELLGGTIHLHQSKQQPAYFSGTIVAHHTIVTTHKRPTRVVFHVAENPDAPAVTWHGRSYRRAAYSGVQP